MDLSLIKNIPWVRKDIPDVSEIVNNFLEKLVYAV